MDYTFEGSVEDTRMSMVLRDSQLEDRQQEQCWSLGWKTFQRKVKLMFYKEAWGGGCGLQ